ncbi:MAG: hypothetical protein JWP87_3770 [Labilithrix sp.]|nr:hypothetical protein [Labilithrix sp.]
MHRDYRAELPRDPDTLRPIALPSYLANGSGHGATSSPAASGLPITARGLAWVAAMTAALMFAFVSGGALVRATSRHSGTAAATMSLEAAPALTGVPVAAPRSAPAIVQPNAPAAATPVVQAPPPAVLQAPAEAAAAAQANDEAASSNEAPAAARKPARKTRRFVPARPTAPPPASPAPSATQRRAAPSPASNDAKQKAIDLLLKASAETPVGG